MPKQIFFKDISSGYAKILGKQIFTHGSFPEVGQKQKTEKKILQGLRVAQAAVTERWP